MATRAFSKHLLREILWDKTPGKVSEEIIDTTRWSVCYKMIFKADDELHYVSYFSRGATEQQDETPYEYDPEDIECERVELVEKTVWVWELVK